ncbi:MAG: HAD-IA family hydrolase [Acidimicrobiia bacterium]|jgi:epoxide hydrolase-like predicted phosphatase
MSSPAAQFDAVVFDLGGVVMPSPLDAFRDYETSMGLPHRFLSEVVLSTGEDGAWSRLERGELTMDEFADEFEAECALAGGTIDVGELFGAVHASSGARPEMVEAIGRIRAEGMKTAALTNNWRADGSAATATSGSVLDGLFDVVVESVVEGLRKPDPRIYELVCERLTVAPEASVFLDDLGVNLKPARAMGMTTIKVGDPAVALAELEGVLGFALGQGGP